MKICGKKQVENNKKGEEIKNVKEILDIIKSNYYQYYERTQNIDNKSGFFIAFHGAVLLLLVNPEKINQILNMQFLNIGQILKYATIVILELGILVSAIISICLFICSLKSRNIKYLSTTICKEIYFNCSNLSLNKELIKTYKEIADYNENIIDKKHTLYNYASVITIVEVVLLGINLIIKIL
ncbi:MAG: hypothetical protein J6J60_02310 [Clostridia bacterium]|nr:hypothetical protein [Clostridia bacterium]